MEKPLTAEKPRIGADEAAKPLNSAVSSSCSQKDLIQISGGSNNATA